VSRIARLAVPVALVCCAPAAAPPAPRGLAPKATASVESRPIVVEPTYAPTSSEAVASLDEHVWPPPRPADDGAEEWVAYDRPWMRRIEGAPPTFYTTKVRPDPNRKAQVEVVALDARQLELDMAIGAEGPWPPDEKTAGKWPRAGGKLPRDPAIATRVVVAFNGAFRLDQNAHGMIIRRRTFAPVVKDVASLFMHDDGRLGFGTLGPSMHVPEDVRSLRQNLEPLLDGGGINPMGRKRWGGILKAKNQVGQRAKRSGICRTAGGHLLYLWGDAIEAQDLGTAMKKAGCDYGMHLDMNVLHIGFVFMSFDDAQYKVGKSEALSNAMGITDKRYVHQPNPKEFFYATLRAPLSGPDASFVPDGQVQPPPTWMPAVLARTQGGVRVTFVDAHRVRFALTPGHDERDAAGKRLLEATTPTPLGGEDAQRVLAALDLGAASKDHPLGLVVSGKTLSKAAGASAALVVDDRGRLTMAVGAPPDARWVAEADAIVVGGKALALPPELSLAIGFTARGDLLIAEPAGTTTPAALVDALLKAGCVRAVAPRGVGKLERAGRDPIASGGRGTRLFVLAEKPAEATYRFDRP